ncbi:MAG: ATP-binding protein [Tepidisphaeraceae bacterium]|jgi:PAS domain S-box-containing protein
MAAKKISNGSATALGAHMAIRSDLPGGYGRKAPDEPAALYDRTQTEQALRTLNEELKERLHFLTAELGEQIAERKRAEEALQASEKRVRAALKVATLHLYNQDRDLRYAWVANPKAGISAEQFLGKRDTDLPMDPTDLQALEALKRRILETGQGANKEIRLRSGETEYYFDVAIEPLHGPDGTIVGLTGTAWDVTKRKQTDEQLKQYQRNLLSLTTQVLLAEESERRRLAVDLHDGMGQTLTLLRMKLVQLSESIVGTRLQEPLREIAQLVDQTLRAASTLTFELSPPVLHELGIVPAARWLGEDIEQRYGLRVYVRDDGYSQRPSDSMAVVLFRCLRELLINVAKHAHTDAAWVSLSRENSHVRVVVEDRGCGFDPLSTPVMTVGEHVRSGFGLFSIRERLKHLGGDMDVRSKRGQGTTVTLTVPLALPSPQEPEKSA